MYNKYVIIITIIIVILCVIGICFFVSKKVEDPTNSISDYNPNNFVDNNNISSEGEELGYNRSTENVTIEVLKDTITRESAEILITDKNEKPFYWGNEFKIQNMNNGKWNDLKCINDTANYNEVINELDENNQVKININYGKYYGLLEDGTYRIVMKVYDGQEIDLYSEEFEIK